MNTLNALNALNVECFACFDGLCIHLIASKLKEDALRVLLLLVDAVGARTQSYAKWYLCRLPCQSWMTADYHQLIQTRMARHKFTHMLSMTK